MIIKNKNIYLYFYLYKYFIKGNNNNFLLKKLYVKISFKNFLK